MGDGGEPMPMRPNSLLPWGKSACPRIPRSLPLLQPASYSSLTFFGRIPASQLHSSVHERCYKATHRCPLSRWEQCSDRFERV